MQLMSGGIYLPFVVTIGDTNALGLRYCIPIDNPRFTTAHTHTYCISDPTFFLYFELVSN